MTRLVFPTDEHYPFQDEHARSVALQIVRDFNPDVRIAGSDGLDFYNLSHFDKNPSRMKEGGLQHEIDMWAAGQREWNDAAPHAHAFFLVGNHEDRLRKHLWRHPEMFGLDVLQLPNILNLAPLGIYWEKDKGDRANLELVVHGRLCLKHGRLARKHSALSAKAHIEDEAFSISLIHGHTHRGGSFYKRTRQGVVSAYEAFCLCSLEPEYTQHPDWQQGIVLATVTPAAVTVEQIPFYRLNGKVVAIWRDKEYREA